MIWDKIFNYFKYKYFLYIYLKKFQKKTLITEKKELIIRRFKNNSYANYLKHQSFKFFLLEKRLDKEFNTMTQYFKKNFKKLKLKKGNTLCLGARTGAEVKAFRELGYFAIGVDIKYPKDSPYVFYGDFHNLDFPDQSFDIIYANILDHVYNYKKFFKEILRTTKRNGKFIFDIQKGIKETGVSNFGNFETYGWVHSDIIIKKILNFKMRLIKKIDLNSNYYQCIFMQKN
jgi:SAM-dependent methyltransferase